MIKVGQKVEFDLFKHMRMIGMTDISEIVEGVVHFVHPTHCWFNVEYGGEEGKRLIGFKFDDIGSDVKLIDE